MVFLSKKIKVTLPQNIYEIIKNDISDFNMTSNYFMNYIFLNLNDKYKNFKGNPAIAEQSKEKSSIQFNLNKESSLIYYDVLRDNNAQNESEFMRSLLIRYATNPKNKRELFIFKESVERINLAIKDKKKYGYGMKEYDGHKIYITSGLGGAFLEMFVRFFAQPEIVIFELKRI